MDVPDELWRLVLSRLESPRTLSTVCQVSKRFRLLATSEELFKKHFKLRAGSRSNCGSGSGLTLTWRTKYRILVALHQSEPNPVSNFRLSDHSGTNTLLAVVQPNILVFYNNCEDCIMSWPHSWSRRRQDVTASSKLSLQSSTVVLGGGEIGFLSLSNPSKESLNLTVVHATTGNVIRRMEMPCMGSTISDSWTKPFLRNSPLALPAGPLGRHVVYLTNGNDLCVYQAETGVVCQVYKEFTDAFERLVRSPHPTVSGGFVVVGIIVEVAGLENCLEVQSVLNRSTICTIELEQGERLVDVVLDSCTAESLHFIGSRVVHGDTVVALTRFRNMDGSWSSRREVLAKSVDVNAVVASPEFEMLHHGRGIFYRPEEPVPFRGAIRVLTRREKDDDCYTVHALAYHRAGCAPFRWARLSSDGQFLFTCAYASGIICVFDLENGGKCRASFCVRETVRDIGLLSDHVLVVFLAEETNNVTAFHFARFCQQFPECLK